MRLRADRGTLAMRESLAAYAFLSPWLAGMLLVTLGPMLFSLYLAFTSYDLLSAPRWIGLENFDRMFTADPRFLSSVRVTLAFVGLSVPLVLVVSMALALLLNRGIRFLAAYRALFYLPSLLSWWGAATRNEKTNDVADMFEKANAGVTVERETTDFGNYWTKLNVQASGKNMPCVTQTQSRQLNDFTKRRVLLSLDPMIKSGAIDVSGIPKEILDSGRAPDGKLYMVPYGAAYDALMVNETQAEKAGVALLEDGYTWEDWRRYLVEAQGKLPNGVKASNLRGGLPNYFIAWVQSHGDQMFGEDGKLGFDKRLLTDFWTMWESLRKAGVTIDAAAQADEPTQPEESYIAQGRLMVDNRPGNALTPSQATLEGKGGGQRLTTLPLPSGEGGSGNVIITSGFSIPTNCDNVPTAAKFIDFWINDPEAAKTFASDNGANTNTKLLQAELEEPGTTELKRHELEVYQQIVEGKPPAIVYPPGYQATFESAFTRAYQDVSFGRKSVAEAVDGFFEEANAGLGG